MTKIDEETRLLCYHSLVEMIKSEQEDACTKLAAVESLREMIEDWNFDENVFLPFVERLFQGLFFIVGNAMEFDSQLQASVDALCLSQRLIIT